MLVLQMKRIKLKLDSCLKHTQTSCQIVRKEDGDLLKFVSPSAGWFTTVCTIAADTEFIIKSIKHVYAILSGIVYVILNLNALHTCTILHPNKYATKCKKYRNACCSCTTVCSCLSPCLSILSSVKLCVYLAFPMADFNSPGTVER